MIGDVLDSTVTGDVVRTIILLIGFTLASACVKFAWIARHNGESYRAWGLLSYGAFLITPAVSGLYRYGQPLNWVTTTTYTFGLVFGVLALRAAYVLAPGWTSRR